LHSCYILSEGKRRVKARDLSQLISFAWGAGGGSSGSFATGPSCFTFTGRAAAATAGVMAAYDQPQAAGGIKSRPQHYKPYNYFLPAHNLKSFPFNILFSK
jgi:hypothetical protein